MTVKANTQIASDTRKRTCSFFSNWRQGKRMVRRCLPSLSLQKVFIRYGPIWFNCNATCPVFQSCFYNMFMALSNVRWIKIWVIPRVTLVTSKQVFIFKVYSKNAKQQQTFNDIWVVYKGKFNVILWKIWALILFCLSVPDIRKHLQAR